MVLTEDDLRIIRQAYRDDSRYARFVSPQANDVLEIMIDDEYFPGVSDPIALYALTWLLDILKPKRVLQLGTHMGFSSVVIADILTHQGQDGRLVTVDPADNYHTVAKEWTEKAGVRERITFLDGFSTDQEIVRQILELGPFDLIYLDSSHMYAATLEELHLIFAEQSWLVEHGALVLHDAATYAQRYDSTNQGGVYRALNEWIDAYPDLYHLLILEPPLWPSVCGLGVVMRRSTTGQTGLRALESAQKISQLEATLQLKNEHILRLEQLLRRIENGRLMRILKRFSR
ncbi:MAG: class I SAM-dependent methyltransferase [Herpetosiphonaceae bacterium]|nr:class I SAM-dependent methyltransferase [Herpetosiphonaceae bacterium]